MPALPHFVQVGESPVLQGDGPETLACLCGNSVLVAGYRPGSLLAIGIQCFRCGEVTITRGLPPGAVLPPLVRGVSAGATPVPTPLPLPPGMVLACETEIARADALARPADPPSEPLTLDAGTLAQWAAIYDEVTGGQLQAHRHAVQQRGDPEAFLPRYPLAWALTRIEHQAGRPGWTWFSSDADSTATAHLMGFRHFLGCWSRHPLFPAMVAGAMADGFSLQAMAVFAGAKALAQSGNRVAFASPAQAGRMEGFSLGPAGVEGLSVTVQRLGRFDWPNGQGAEPAALRGALLEAMSAAQGRVHLKRPGMLIVSPGSVRPDFDRPLVDAINAALRTQGRRHRGITAVAAVLPKLLATRRTDQVGFGWSFYPIANPHQTTGVATRIGSREDFAGLDEAREPPIPS